MADSACDVGVREVEDVYACHLVKGEIANSFVGLKACENSKAPGIKAAVETAMTEVCGDWKEKTVALGADGANVMLGEISGVYGLLNKKFLTLLRYTALHIGWNFHLQTPCQTFQFLKMSKKCFKVFGSTIITLQRQSVSLKN